MERTGAQAEWAFPMSTNLPLPLASDCPVAPTDYNNLVESRDGMTYHLDMTESETVYCTSPDRVEEVVRRDLRRHVLLRGVRRLGLAVSGGADSTALLHILLPLCREADVEATVLHFNHGLRAAADDEQRFVQAMAETAGVRFLTETGNVPTRTEDGSLEMAARQARMAFLASCAAHARLDAVATGHQADDVAETVLLRLARGSGAAGLAGLRPISRLSAALILIRPLLSVSGAALRGWLRLRNFDWCEDASNQNAAIPRNFVRHALLPKLEKIWQPNIRASLCRSAAALREDDAFLDALAARARADVQAGDALSAAALSQQPESLRRRILRQWLFERGCPEAAGFATVSALLDQGNAEGWQAHLPSGRLASNSGGLLRIETDPAEAADDEAELRVPGAISWNGLVIEAEPGTGILAQAEGIGRYPAACSLALRALAGKPLRVRRRRPGDRFSPTGLDGSKKLHDLFIDAKVPETMRDCVPVICHGDAIAWVPGHRIDRAFALTGPDEPCVRLHIRRS